MNEVVTRPGWAPELMPTADEWLEWFERCTPTERLTIAARIVRDVEEAKRCFLYDHDGTIAVLRGEIRRSASALETFDDVVAERDRLRAAARSSDE